MQSVTRTNRTTVYDTLRERDLNTLSNIMRRISSLDVKGKNKKVLRKIVNKIRKRNDAATQTIENLQCGDFVQYEESNQPLRIRLDTHRIRLLTLANLCIKSREEAKKLTEAKPSEKQKMIAELDIASIMFRELWEKGVIDRYHEDIHTLRMSTLGPVFETCNFVARGEPVSVIAALESVQNYTKKMINETKTGLKVMGGLSKKFAVIERLLSARRLEDLTGDCCYAPNLVYRMNQLAISVSDERQQRSILSALNIYNSNLHRLQQQVNTEVSMVSGNVTDESTGAGIENASIRVMHIPGELQAVAVTDSDGYFTLGVPFLPPFTIEVLSDRYGLFTEEITERMQELNISLGTLYGRPEDGMYIERIPSGEERYNGLMLMTVSSNTIDLTWPLTGFELQVEWDPDSLSYKGSGGLSLQYNRMTKIWENNLDSNRQTFIANPDPSVYTPELILAGYLDYENTGTSEILCLFIEGIECLPPAPLVEESYIEHVEQEGLHRADGVIVVSVEGDSITINWPKTGRAANLVWIPEKGVYEGDETELRQEFGLLGISWLLDSNEIVLRAGVPASLEDLALEYKQLETEGWSEVLCTIIADVRCEPFARGRIENDAFTVIRRTRGAADLQLPGLERGAPKTFQSCDVNLYSSDLSTYIGTFSDNDELVQFLNSTELGWASYLRDLPDGYYKVEYTLNNPSELPAVFWKELYLIDSTIAQDRARKGGVFYNMPPDQMFVRHNDPNFIQKGIRHFNGASLASLSLDLPDEDKYSMIAMTEDPYWIDRWLDGLRLTAGYGICLLEAQIRLDVAGDFDFQAFTDGVDGDGITDTRPFQTGDEVPVHLNQVSGRDDNRSAKDDFEDGEYLYLDRSAAENLVTGTSLFHTAAPDESAAIADAIYIDSTFRSTASGSITIEVKNGPCEFVQNEDGIDIGFWIPPGRSGYALTPACRMMVVGGDGTIREIYYINRDKLGAKEAFDNVKLPGSSSGGSCYHCFWIHSIKYPEAVAEPGYRYGRAVKQFTIWCDDVNRWGWEYRKGKAYRLVAFGEEWWHAIMQSDSPIPPITWPPSNP